MLAQVQALLLYQIMRLFDGDVSQQVLRPDVKINASC